MVGALRTTRSPAAARVAAGASDRIADAQSARSLFHQRMIERQGYTSSLPSARQRPRAGCARESAVRPPRFLHVGSVNPFRHASSRSGLVVALRGCLCRAAHGSDSARSFFDFIG